MEICIPLDLGKNLNFTWEGHLNEASIDWNLGQNVLETSLVSGSTSARRCKTSSGNVQVCNAAYGNNGWLGIAGISVSGGHITAGYVKVNDTYFNSGTYNDPNWRQYVMCQEVGHTFGLGHVDENFNNENSGTCMDYGSPLGPPPNLYPNLHDYAMLEDIYSHLDGESGGGGGVGGGSGGCNPRSPKCNGSTAGVSAADILAHVA